MKKSNVSILAIALSLVAVLINGCLKDKCTNSMTYTKWTPIYASDADMRANPTMQTARPLKNPGKIYFYNDYMLINEEREGVHIILNSNVQSPQNIGFLAIKGNVDIAVKGDMLYADAYTDLLAIDISNILQPRVAKRVQDVYVGKFWRDPQRGWLVGYNQERVTEDFDCTDPRLNNGGFFVTEDRSVFSVNASFPTGATKSSGAAPSNAGTGGSMARFTLYNDYLYCINQAQVQVYNIKQLSNPQLANTINVAWNIETLFPFKTNLFIGSTTGMFIYDLTNPVVPTQLSVFTHGRACDPVVVEGNRAYVTLRSGTNCNNASNQLDIVDITNLRTPQLLKSYPMKNPRGLSVMDNTLYLCDDGFKIYDVTNADDVDKKQKAHIQNFDTFDVIAFYKTDKQKVAMVIGKDGFYQYDVSNPAQPKELSKIPVVK
jgi:hypothetical protein